MKKSRKNLPKIEEMYHKFYKEMKSKGSRKNGEDSKELFTEIGEEIKVQSKKREELNQKHRDFLRRRRTCKACVRS